MSYDCFENTWMGNERPVVWLLWSTSEALRIPICTLPSPPTPPPTPTPLFSYDVCSAFVFRSLFLTLLYRKLSASWTFSCLGWLSQIASIEFTLLTRQLFGLIAPVYTKHNDCMLLLLFRVFFCLFVFLLWNLLMYLVYILSLFLTLWLVLTLVLLTRKELCMEGCFWKALPLILPYLSVLNTCTYNVPLFSFSFSSSPDPPPPPPPPIPLCAVHMHSLSMCSFAFNRLKVSI